MRTRQLEITADTIRAYSRRGNYHSDAETAMELGLPGLVAQGMQVAGAAYGELLDAWGEDFLAQGALDLRFVGAVLADTTVEARIDIIDDETASIEIVRTNDARPAVIGTARRTPAR